jgi:hypothetical protein
MPLLLRAARVDEVPPGTSRVVKVRGARVRLVHLLDAWFAFDAESAPMSERVTGADLEWARRSAARGYRVVVRGPFVHVALDPDRESAPASVQRNADPTPVGG